MLVKAMAETTGRSEKWIKAKYEEEGDLGRVAVMARSTQRTMFQPKALTAAGVLESFRKIAAVKGGSSGGPSSGDEKRRVIGQLLTASRQNEAGYIIRALQGKLRIGVQDSLVLLALGQAAFLVRDAAGLDLAAEPRLASRIEAAAAAAKHAFSVCPAYDVLVPHLLERGTLRLREELTFTIGVPCKCMLAKPTKGVREVLDRFGDAEFTCEYKYDGERAQVHVMADGAARVYSRNAEDTTPKYPDVCEILRRARRGGVSSIVVDGEVVAYNRETGRIEPFQKLSTRSKKGVDPREISVKVCYFAFDLLYLNGRDLLSEPLIERRRLLRESLAELEGECRVATSIESTDVDELQSFLDASVRDGTEGLIVKTLRENATYEPSRRSLNWLKLKKDYVDGMGDSLDLVPIGAWHGKGKRTGVFGAFLLACYDDEGERYQTICKVGTGFSEEALVSLSEELAPRAVDAPPKYYEYSRQEKPDVWFAPAAVWEVKAADLSISPKHLAASGRADPTKGIALRFPRFIRRRDDKRPEMATTATQVLDFYNSQEVVANNKRQYDSDGEDD